MSKTTYLISGASRGLGLETARQLLAASPENRIIAAARDPAGATQLQDLIKANPGRIAAAKIDVADPESIKTGVADLANFELAKDGVDVLLNNAGVFNPSDATAATAADIDHHFKINIYGAILLTLEVLPLLRKGRDKKIFVTSSIMGSIASAPTLPYAAVYSMSKAAVNMYFVKLATQLGPDGFTVILFHPGYVKTDMNGGVDGPAAIFKEDSVALTLKNVLNRGKSDNGKFVSYDGTDLPW